jgi:putative ATP-binding cassette transporter
VRSSGIPRLLAFLARGTRDLPGSRARIATVVVTGAASGLASAGLIALINSALVRGGLRTPALAWGFAGLCLLLPASRFISGALLVRVAGSAVFDLRVKLARRILAAPLRRLEELGAHRLTAALTDDVTAIIEAFTVLPDFLMQLAIVAGCLGYLAWLSWTAFLAVLAFMAAGVLSYRLPQRGAARYLARAREAADDFFHSLQALVRGTKELKLHGGRRSAFFAHAYEPAARALQTNGVAGRTVLLAAASWGHVLFFLLIGLLLVTLPRLAGGGAQLSTGYILVILYMMSPLTGIMNLIPVLSTAAVSVGKLESLGLTLDAEAEPAGALGPAPDAGWQRLELAGVAHRYRVEGEAHPFTLGPLDLVLHPGELLFVIGGNGSGKTTLAKLLCGLYPPESGEIRLDRETITETSRERYRQHFSAVFADFFVFESLLGLVGEGLDARAHGYLRELGLERNVAVRDGRLSTVDLSQGQRKRLALLAAYLEDRPIYVFDEWAADQDPVFKEIFYRRLLPDLKARGKTVVVVTHDDRYFGAADRIVKLESGSIAEAAPAPTSTVSSLAAQGALR